MIFILVKRVPKWHLRLYLLFILDNRHAPLLILVNSPDLQPRAASDLAEVHQRHGARWRVVHDCFPNQHPAVRRHGIGQLLQDLHALVIPKIVETPPDVVTRHLEKGAHSIS